MAYKVFSNGDALTGGELNTYLMNQAVISFATTTARDAALPSPSEGQLVWLEDSNKYVYYTGSAWSDLITPASSGNVIINGAIEIAQRGTASVTPTTNLTYTLDRWVTQLTAASKFSVQQNAGSVTPPSGFSAYLGVTSLSSYSVASGDTFAISQRIEGYNSAQFLWGTASAKTVTLSFYVYSSLTGTHSGSITNESENRSYPFTFTVSSANTWTLVSVVIPGDTSGTWGTAQGAGVKVFFNLGVGSTYAGTAGAWTGSGKYGASGAVSVVGTNAATFYLTGVQLEAGSSATPFKRNAPSIGLEQDNAERYLAKFGGDDLFTPIGIGSAGSSTGADIQVNLKTSLRTNPTGVEWSTLCLYDQVTITPVTAVSLSGLGTKNVRLTVNVSGGLTQYRTYMLLTNNSLNGYLRLPAEL